MANYRLDETMELAIYNWITAASGINFIWDKQDISGSGDAIRPDFPYGTLDILNIGNDGEAAQKYKELDTYTYQFKKIFTLSIDVFTKNAHFEIMSNILDSLELASFLVTLQNAGIAVWGNSDPLDLSALEDTAHVLRAHTDIFMAYGKDKDDVSGEIQKVNIEGAIDHHSRNFQIEN